MGVRLRPGDKCKCCPSDGYHQYDCPVSQKMRVELMEAAKARHQQPPDPTKRAKVTPRTIASTPRFAGSSVISTNQGEGTIKKP